MNMNGNERRPLQGFLTDDEACTPNAAAHREPGLWDLVEHDLGFLCFGTKAGLDGLLDEVTKHRPHAGQQAEHVSV